jgi:hypothetical protein
VTNSLLYEARDGVARVTFNRPEVHNAWNQEAMVRLADAMKDFGEDAAQLSQIDQAKLDVWVTKDNIPVKIAMDMKGKTEDGSAMAVNMELNVTDLNSDKVKIEAPI